MSMTKVLGAAFQTGVTASGISGVHEQSATKSQAGELKEYKDKDGKTIAVYAVDRHVEYTFEAILASSVQDKKVGDTATVGGVTGCVTKWDVTESNEDVKKVSIAVRTFEDLQA